MSALTNQLAADIRSELRSIIRQRDELRKPLGALALIEAKAGSGPCYCVLFDSNPRKQIVGLKIGIKSLTLPDERITNSVFEYAKSVWQLKDRLKLWVKVQGLAIDVEAEANRSSNLLVCADLANWKKHGKNRNRSGLDPRLGLVTFDTSNSGVVELYYDGASKEKELLVTNPVPIPFAVDVLINKGTAALGDAVDIISRAFSDWFPLIQNMGVLAGPDRESEYLRGLLFSATP